MKPYLDIFIRDTLGEANTLPRLGAKTESPDIILAGTDKPETLGADSDDQNLGTAVVYGQKNYIYVRGKNYSDTLAVGTVSLYAAYQTQLSIPGAWKQLSTDGGSNTASAAADSNGIAVISDPFVWTPTAPSEGNPYLLIAVIATKTNPDPVPAYKKTPEDFAKWQANQGGASALSIAVPVPPKPKSTYAFNAVVNFGSAAPVTANFNLEWTGAVAGDLISLSADAPGTQGPIGFDDFAITTSSQNTGFKAQVPANYSPVVQYQYKAKDAKKVPAPTLTLIVSTVQDKGRDGSGDDPFGNGGNSATETQIATYQFKTVLASS
jgi:hypothetical protein